MSNRAKTILVVLVTITLAGVGYFLYINKPKQEVLPPVNTPPKIEEIDTSDWQMYRNEKLGFEIKMPKEWVKSGESIGSQPNLEDEFWQEQVGGASFDGHFDESTKSSPQFYLRAKDSDLTIKEFGDNADLGESIDIFINNLPAKKSVHDARPRGSNDYQERILIKNRNRYYYFEFFAGITNIPEDIKVWNEIITTFKPTSK